jgi:hypothetical protein
MLFVDGGNDRVGIGTASPDFRLVVQGAAATNDNIFKIEDSAGTKMASLEQDSSGNGRWIVCDTSGNADVLIHTAGNSYFNGGNVGIGTTSPDARLDIEGMAAGEQALLITSGRNDALSNGLARINITDANCPFTGLQIDHAGTGIALDVGGVMRASTGIEFGTDTAAANQLDDYEEGTWTPTWTGANSANATYTKVGRVVYASGTFTATGSGTSGDCAGLPYTSTIDGSDGGGSGYHAQDTVTWNVLKTSGAGFRFYTGSSQIQLTGSSGTRFFLTYNV